MAPPRQPAHLARRALHTALLHAAAVVLVGLMAAVPARGDITVDNIAAASLVQEGTTLTIESNPVVANVAEPIPTLEFFGDAGFNSPRRVARSDATLFVRLTAAACESDPSRREKLQILLRSVRTGDWETYEVTENPNDPSDFPGDLPIKLERRAGGVVGGDGHLEVARHDTIIATVVSDCREQAPEERLLIDPGGIVFDSVTDETVTGVTVTLIDVTGAGNGGQANAPAEVYDYDGVTRAPSTVVTTDDGSFSFPLVAPSVYRLAVTPPRPYAFPSQVPFAQLPPDRFAVEGHSYGESFAVNVDTGDVLFDVPVDAVGGALGVRKTAGRQRVEIAESLPYRIDVQNTSEVPLRAVQVQDRMPRGFTYVAGSATLDGERLPDPGRNGSRLTFDLGTVTAAQTRVLSYRLLVGAGALQGDGINRAYATSGALVTSNTASARVEIDGGVFDDKGFVLGRVFADCDRNGAKQESEPGVPGVRLFLEDGTFVVTDELGAYSFYGIRPGTHVLKVDDTTLPPGAKLVSLEHRSAGRGGTAFVDLQSGELHRTDFALDGCDLQLVSAVEQRRARADADNAEIARGVRAAKNAEVASQPRSDPRALAASGIVDEQSLAPRTRAGSIAGAAGSAQAGVALEQLAETLAPEPGFVDLVDGAALRAGQTAVRVKGPAGATFRLDVNGVAVSDTRVGTRAVAAGRGVEVREYVGVALVPGRNELKLSITDPFGNVRPGATIHVRAPGALARIVMTPVAESAPADGRTQLAVEVRLEDDAGELVAARTAVTLQTSAGEWQQTDVDTLAADVQTFVDGGTARLAVLAPSTPARARLRVFATDAVDSVRPGEVDVDFVPELRPLIAAGVVEGVFDLRRLRGAQVESAGASDGFEQELRTFASGGDDGRGAARAAVFLKGKVKGKYLLTLGYDSDKERNSRLFRDIQPDRYYPIYGDSSIKGFDAQSTGRLYVRVDRGTSYVLLGDFTTPTSTPERNLAAYSRSLNGVSHHLEHGPFELDAFASRDNLRQVVQEIPANGTSGPFQLVSRDLRENSERVEVITRDRNQRAVIVDAVILQRFTDYEIDSFTGRLVLRAPMPSVDRDLNPVSLRVTYEVDTNGPDFWVAGFAGQVQLGPRVAVGGTYVTDRNPQDRGDIAGANVSVRVARDTTLIAEAARTERDTTGEGWGRRFELRRDGTAVRLRAFAGATDAGFDNPTASLSRARNEAGLQASVVAGKRLRFVAEGLHSEDRLNGATRDGGLVGVEQGFGANSKAELALRRVSDDPAIETEPETSTTSVRLRVTTPVPLLPRASVFGEYEQDVADADRRVAALGGSYEVARDTRVYLRHELISSLQGPYDLDPTQRQNTTVFGVDTRYLRDDHLFSEYRVANGIDGREAQAAIGLRNMWELAEGVALSTRFERIRQLAGEVSNEGTALAGALEYTRNPLWKGTARLEGRSTRNGDSLFSTLGIARKLGEDWSFLARNVLALTDGSERLAGEAEDRLQAGFAWRDSGNNLANALMRYEYRQQEGGTLGGEGGRHQAHIVSAHLDYRPQPRLTLTGRLAGKIALERYAEGSLRSDAQLVALRATRDFGKRWDLGVAFRELFSEGMSSRQSAIGAEIGFLLRADVWLSGGYNFTGFYDRDLSDEEYTRRGAYLRLRFKFDEHLFGTGAP